MPLILGANSVSGYTVKNSLRFNSASSDNLTRTPASTTNRRTFTLSFWLKRTSLASGNKCPFAIGNSAVSIADADWFILMLHGSTNTLRLVQYNNVIFATNRVFRDIGAWYHIVVAVDTTQATASNRVKLYINGTQETSYSSSADPSLNYQFNVNTTTQHMIGREDGNGSAYFDGYLSDYYFIDGQQLDPSSFGSTDTDTGIWIPKAYTGSFGTNGFYLDFEDSANLGNDMSGNNNDFTVNNLTSIDQTTDTPTNNFSTLNSVLYSTSISLTEGNLKFTNSSAGSQRMNASTIAPTTGKWYAECKVTSEGGAYPQIGVFDISIYTFDTYVGALARGYGYASHGQVYNNAGALTTGLATYTNGDIIGVALDLTNNYVYFSKNGVFINSGVPTSGSSGTGGWAITDGYDYAFSNSSLDSGTDPVFEWNFGNAPFTIVSGNADGAGYGNFEYAVPSGYYALCTKNLANFG
jgi:hypothetical protein